MASRRLAQKLFSFSKCTPGAQRQAAVATVRNVETAVGGKLAESGLHQKFNKSRALSSAVRQAEESASELKNERGARQGLLRRGAYSPFGELDMFDSLFPNKTLRSMIETMDRFFEEPFLGRYGSRLQQAGSRAAFRYRTPWDFSETKDAFRMRLDLPGLSKEEVKVFVEDGSLVIKGESLQEKAAHETEGAFRKASQYHTKIVLPENANPEAVKAELKNGVLSVEIPKLPEIEPKKNIIDVQID